MCVLKIQKAFLHARLSSHSELSTAYALAERDVPWSSTTATTIKSARAGHVSRHSRQSSLTSGAGARSILSVRTPPPSMSNTRPAYARPTPTSPIECRDSTEHVLDTRLFVLVRGPPHAPAVHVQSTRSSPAGSMHPFGCSRSLSLNRPVPFLLRRRLRPDDPRSLHVDRAPLACSRSWHLLRRDEESLDNVAVKLPLVKRIACSRRPAHRRKLDEA